VISKSELKELANARLEDSKILYEAKRYDGAVYICGYVIELGLKLRICKTLKWEGFPSLNREFSDFRSFKTHNLNVLLALSGIEEKVKSQFLPE
jgi:HEPN domain-containing protein